MDAPKKLIFVNRQSPGDILMLTAAVRDLHRAYPNRFITDAQTTCMELWENNPYITPLDPTQDRVTIIQCHYPMINCANQWAYHFIHGFTDYLNRIMSLSIRVTDFKGDLYFSPEELARPSIVEQKLGQKVPYWIMVAGGKWDVTIKWWEHSRFQEVVDRCAGRILFVQVGEKGRHFHPPLRNVLDLRGQTSLRDLALLTYHAQGVVCPVTAAMHMAAAVPSQPGTKGLKPCVVIAGGREPPHWEAYPGHQFIHTVGMLPCCQDGGCWKSRVLPVGDGHLYDMPGNRCQMVVRGILPKCMDMITSDEVIRRINGYLAGGMARLLYPTEVQAVKAAGIWP